MGVGIGVDEGSDDENDCGGNGGVYVVVDLLGKSLKHYPYQSVLK